jgi:hypothetical protein
MNRDRVVKVSFHPAPGTNDRRDFVRISLKTQTAAMVVLAALPVVGHATGSTLDQLLARSLGSASARQGDTSPARETFR